MSDLRIHPDVRDAMIALTSFIDQHYDDFDLLDEIAQLADQIDDLLEVNDG